MSCYTCGTGRGTSALAAISRAMAKAAGARLRAVGAVPTARDWAARAAVCERCPLRVIHRGASYCGTPFLRQVNRDPTVDGCGCPTRDKAKSPVEHCPITPRHAPAESAEGRCSCKWCQAAL